MNTETHWNVAQRNDDTLRNYLTCCREAAETDNTFQTFKSDSRYTPILEHAHYRLGVSHLNNIKNNNAELLENYPTFWDNDKYGDPTVQGFEGRNCSATTLQYISVLSNLIKLVGDLTGYTVFEIGGGYGGQAKILTDVFKVQSYDIVDLYEATLLQNKYIHTLQIPNTKGYTIESYKLKDSYDLTISNYALSEITDPQQTWYVDNILLRSKHGYITCNGPIYGIDKLQEKYKESFKILPDIEGERESNYIITW